MIALRLLEGRTGSTLVMQLLGTSPDITFDRRYPAEYRFLSYFVRLAEQMTEPFDEARHPGVTPFFFGEQATWGPIPFRSDVVDIAELRGPLLRSMWATWSEEVRRAQSDVRFYAEKLAVPIEPIVRAGIDLRVIDLIRDPRDVLASIRAFTSAGNDGFERDRHSSETAYVDAFIASLTSQLEWMRDTPAGVNRITIRYEDLVADLPRTADRIAEWLGLPFAVDAVVRQRESYRHHMTAPSVEESVGRYTRDLLPGEAVRIGDALAPLLDPYGYEF